LSRSWFKATERGLAARQSIGSASAVASLAGAAPYLPATGDQRFESQAKPMSMALLGTLPLAGVMLAVAIVVIGFLLWKLRARGTAVRQHPD
jgi:hypothetical protein